MFIFDSYNTTAGNTGSDTTIITSVMTTITDKNIYNISSSGSGFVRDVGAGRFYDRLVSWIASNPTIAPLIDCLYVAAGRNDWTATKAQIKAAISQFKAYAWNNLPNLKALKVAYIANGDNDVSHGTRAEQYACKKNWIASCNELGVEYVNNIDSVLHYYKNMSSDGVHPNQDGKTALAYALVQSLAREFNFYADLKTLNITALTGFTFTEGQQSIAEIDNGLVIFRPSPLIHVDFAGGTLTTSTLHLDVATVDDNSYMRYPYANIKLPYIVGFRENGIFTPIDGGVRLLPDGTFRIDVNITTQIAAKNLTRLVLFGCSNSTYPADYM